MLKVGVKVKVINLPYNNKEYWFIPYDILGCIGTIVEISEEYTTIEFGDDGTWNFPSKCDDFLSPITCNKWNLTGYVPRGERLKLP